MFQIISDYLSEEKIQNVKNVRDAMGLIKQIYKIDGTETQSYLDWLHKILVEKINLLKIDEMYFVLLQNNFQQLQYLDSWKKEACNIDMILQIIFKKEKHFIEMAINGNN